MSYTKNIAVIKGVKEGFSADGGPLSGIVKAERYSGNLKVEVSLINFAPLTEGRYVVALSDGKNTQIVENCLFEGQSEVDTGNGFSAAVFYVNGSVRTIAAAVCGNCSSSGLREAVESAERLKPSGEEKGEAEGKTAPSDCENYEDEAIAEVNYYEFATTDESGEPVCESTQKTQDRCQFCQNEEGVGNVEKKTDEVSLTGTGKGSPLARGEFYKKMKAEIEGILSAYPPCEELSVATDGARWVKISYGDRFYVFGVLCADEIPRYICYGVPSDDPAEPPQSMRGLASFLPVKTQHGQGFWIMYQDADTGAKVGVTPR